MLWTFGRLLEVLVQESSSSWSVGWKPVGAQRTFYNLSSFPSRCFPTVVIMLIVWAKSRIGSDEHLTTGLFFQTIDFLLWLSCSLDFFLLFLAVVSALIRLTLLLYPGLWLTSECVGLCTPKGVPNLYLSKNNQPGFNSPSKYYWLASNDTVMVYCDTIPRPRSDWKIIRSVCISFLLNSQMDRAWREIGN